ncbi:MAG: hypothetical protein HY691_16250 [Chloroflexi bacterium]|nr:hypothetical protein [Chloroflexota bacterium]
MPIDLFATRAAHARAAATPRVAASFWYSLYGMRVRSEVALPVPALAPAEGGTPDLAIRCLSGASPPEPDGPMVAWAPCRVHGADTRVYRGPGGAWIWMRDLGTCHISADARQADLYPADGADPRTLGLVLVGPIALYAVHKRGRPTLHASAVVTAHGAAAFVGPPNQGKSTIAACFLRRGAALLTDDALPLQARDDGVYGEPGPPMMKLWRATAECALALSDDLPDLMAGSPKKLLALDGRFVLAEAPARMRAVYVLHRYDPAPTDPTDVVVKALNQRDGLAVLLAQTSNRSYLLPTEQAAFLPLLARLVAQAPVRILSYPSGFEHQEAVYARVVGDLAMETEAR